MKKRLSTVLAFVMVFSLMLSTGVSAAGYDCTHDHSEDKVIVSPVIESCTDEDCTEEHLEQIGVPDEASDTAEALDDENDSVSDEIETDLGNDEKADDLSEEADTDLQGVEAINSQEESANLEYQDMIMSYSTMSSSSSSWTINGKTVPFSKWTIGSYFNTSNTGIGVTGLPCRHHLFCAPSGGDECNGNAEPNCFEYKGAIQCVGFAYMMYEHIWGKYPREDYTGSGKYPIGDSNKTIRKYIIDSIPLGSVIIVKGTGANDHYLVLVDKDEDEFTTLEANRPSNCEIFSRTIEFTNIPEGLIYISHITPPQYICQHNFITNGCKRICSKCTYVIYSHNLNDYWECIVQPKCNEKGIDAQKCKNCSYMDKRETNFGNHIYSSATCIKPQTCVCGVTMGEPKGHKYDESWLHTILPTCTEPGYDSNACSVCGSVKTIEVPSLGHCYGEWYQTQAATCTKNGEYLRVCEKCSHVETNVTSKLTHVEKIPNCYENPYCVRCGIGMGGPIGHDYSIPANCLRGIKCSRCDATSGNPNPHNFSIYTSTAIYATCTSYGLAVYSCSNYCGNTTGKQLPMLSHYYNIAATCSSPAKCGSCGATTGSVLTHTWAYPYVSTYPSCTRGGVNVYTCVHCSALDYVATPALNHSFAAATCTKPQTCTRCGTTAGGPLGHSYSAATCTKARTCSKCQVTYGSPLGHSWVYYSNYMQCSRCKTRKALT